MRTLHASPHFAKHTKYASKHAKLTGGEPHPFFACRPKHPVLSIRPMDASPHFAKHTKYASKHAKLTGGEPHSFFACRPKHPF